VRRHAKASASATTRRQGQVLCGVLAILAIALLAPTAALATAPAVTIEPAAEVGFTTALGEGEVDPGSKETFCHFEYISDDQFEENVNVNSLPGFEGAAQAPCDVEPLTGSGAQPVKATLSGLVAATEYHLRLLASNEDGPGEDIAANFTTQSATAPALSVDPVEPATVTATSAHIAGAINPEGGNVDPIGPTAVPIFWQLQTNLEGAGWELAEAGTIEGAEAESSSPIAVAKDLAGLQPGSEYKFRFLASYAGEEAISSEGAFETDPVAPEISATAVFNVTTTSATLHAQVNPGGAATTYHFEYLTLAEFEAAGESFTGAASTPESTPTLGDNALHSANAELAGLAPDTAYRYRIVATNSASAPGGTAGPVKGLHTAAVVVSETDTCPNAARRAEQHSAYLAACRAYEMVSPLDKNGGDVMGDPSKTRVATDGSAVSFGSLSAFGDAIGTGITTEYMGIRGPAGWATHSIMPPQVASPFGYLLLNQAPLYQGEFSDDLSKGVFRALSPLTDAPNVAEVRNFYLREDLRTPGTGSYRLLNDSATFIPAGPPPNTPQYRAKLLGASSDFSHVLFESTLNLTADVPPQPSACESNINECLERVYEWDDGIVRFVGILPDPDGPGPLTGSAAEDSGVSKGGTTDGYTPHVISSDGSRIFFSAPVQGLFNPDTQLYMRRDHAETVRLNASEKAVPDAQQAAVYQGATPDGSKVYFTTAESLIDGTGGGGLYVYDTTLPDGAENLTRLAGGIDGLLGTSDDGSYVYFASGGGISVWHNGSVRAVGFTNTSSAYNRNIGGDTSLEPKVSRVSRDGRVLEFESERGEGLTGYDHGDSCGAGGGNPCTEVYVYEYDGNGGAGRLACASCNPSGEPATAPASGIDKAGTGGTGSTQHLNRILTDDGRRVFFTSAEALVAGDTNAAKDVYEYNVESGEQHLITSGTDPSNSYFLDASASGDDVFFITRARLLPGDVDNLYDIYDARVGGGFVLPPTPPAPCEGTTCRSATSPPPNAPTSASSTFSGAGNPAARAKCKKGSVRKHKKGRCVKRRQHRANHNRGGSK
jgi:hypothetical protein